jgi:hypothetical protein
VGRNLIILAAVNIIPNTGDEDALRQNIDYAGLFCLSVS